jgi:hypothetical protein
MEAADSELPMGRLNPYLGDKRSASGTASGHYFHQDLLVARRVFEARPSNHLDVGSRVDGFVAHVACFRQIDILDFRPLKSSVNNIRIIQCDMTLPIPDELRGEYDSLSCLHAIEHFGLGRYGDRIDVDGHIRGIFNMAQLLTPGGTLYLSAPLGRSRVEFNAHRVFSVGDLISLVEPYFEVTRLSCVDDNGDLHDDVSQDFLRRSEYDFGLSIIEATRRRD